MTRLILDGGTGSELRRRGVSLSEHCWSASANLSHRELLVDIHCDYIASGADIVTANTFATSRFVLAGAGLDSRFEEINRNAITAVQEARKESTRPVRLAASLSCFPPAFDHNAYPQAKIESRAYAELADCFSRLGVDLILVEMLQDTVHSARACHAAKESGLPFWAGISCRLHADGRRLVSFDNESQAFEPVLETILSFAPTGIAVMHSPLDAMEPALEQIRKVWKGPTGAYAEVGYAADPHGNRSKPTDPAEYAQAASRWCGPDLGLIGGCCGTTPAHIAQLAKAPRVR